MNSVSKTSKFVCSIIVAILIIVGCIFGYLYYDYNQYLDQRDNFSIESIPSSGGFHLDLPGITYRHAFITNNTSKIYDYVEVNISCYCGLMRCGYGTVELQNVKAYESFMREPSIRSLNADRITDCNHSYEVKEYEFFDWLKLRN